MRHLSITLHHIVGTCAMGDSEDAVLDQELRVRGLKNLRFINTSVMPDFPAGNIMILFPGYDWGERGTDYSRFLG